MANPDYQNAEILIADDDPLVCNLIRIQLQHAGFDNLSIVTEGREALKRATSRHLDLVLLDITMPDLDGLEVLNLVKNTSPKTHVIMLTARENPDYVSKAIALGASGYLIKGTLELNSLSDTVRLVLEGETVVVDQRLLREAAKRVPSPPSNNNRGGSRAVDYLTPQELEVLKLLAAGLSNADIGTALHISYNTVKSHVSNIYEKLQVSDRTQAAVFALRQGIGRED